MRYWSLYDWNAPLEPSKISGSAGIEGILAMEGLASPGVLP
jgi:hypothetical protein